MRNTEIERFSEYTLLKAAFPFLLSLLAISFIAAFVFNFYPSESDGTQIDSLKELYVREWQDYLLPEAAERFSYVITTLSIVPVVLSMIFLSRKFWGLTGLNQAFLIIAFVICYIPIFFDDNFANLFFIGTTARRIEYLIYASFIVTALIFLLWRLPHPENFLAAHPRFRWWIDIMLGAALLAATILSAIAGRLRSASMVYEDLHFEAVFYSVSQVSKGATLLSDLPAQYGFYAELLQPIIYFTGSSVLNFSSLMVAILVVAWSLLTLSCIMIFHSLIIRSVVAVSLLYVVGSTWIVTGLHAHAHEYFQIWPIRFLFPSAALFLFLLSLKFPKSSGITLAWLAVAAFAPIWNVDSGIPVLGASVAVLLARATFSRGKRAEGTRGLGLIFGLCIAFVITFAFVLSAKSGQTMAWHDALKYQQIFYASGFGMLPLPLDLHPWMAVAALYVFGITFGLTGMVHRLGRGTTLDAVLFLSVLGLGLFTYYQGRSHDVQLTFVAWPAIVIAGILLQEAADGLRSGRLRLLAAFSAFPLLFALVLVSLQWLHVSPQLLPMLRDAIVEIGREQENPLRVDIDFIRKNVRGKPAAVIIDKGQSVLFAETGLRSAIAGPGLAEMVLREDLDDFIAALAAGRAEDIFIRLDEDGSIPERYRLVLNRYDPGDVSPYGLQHLVVRASAR